MMYIRIGSTITSKKHGNASSVLNSKVFCLLFGADHSFLFSERGIESWQ